MYQQDFSAALGLITHLTNEELKELYNDDSKVDDLLKDNVKVKDLESEKEMLLASLRSIAELNLTREPELTEGKQKLLERYKDGEEISQRVQEKIKELSKYELNAVRWLSKQSVTETKAGSTSLDTTLALLQAGASEIEEESEKTVERFLQSEIEADEFLDSFLTTRKLMHLRKVKADKLQALMSRKPLFPSNYINAPSLGINQNYFPSSVNSGSVPYPTGPLNMPMPGVYFNRF